MVYVSHMFSVNFVWSFSGLERMTPRSITEDSQGLLYITDITNQTIIVMTPEGRIQQTKSLKNTKDLLSGRPVQLAWCQSGSSLIIRDGKQSINLIKICDSKRIGPNNQKEMDSITTAAAIVDE